MLAYSNRHTTEIKSGRCDCSSYDKQLSDNHEDRYHSFILKLIFAILIILETSPE